MARFSPRSTRACVDLAVHKGWWGVPPPVCFQRRDTGDERAPSASNVEDEHGWDAESFQVGAVSCRHGHCEVSDQDGYVGVDDVRSIR